MTPKKSKKSASARFLEKAAGRPLSFGALLEAIRLGEGMSQTEFGCLLGISRSHVCDLEKGRKIASPARAAKFALVLGYAQDQFVRLALQALVEQAGLRLQVRVEAA